MIRKISFKNYKSFKERQELELRPITVLIGKNSSGKSAVTKLTTLIENSLTTDSDAPLKWNGYENGVELGAEFEDLLYGRSKIGQLEIELQDESEDLKLIISTDKGIPKIFSWTFKGSEKSGFDEKFVGFKLLTDEPHLIIKSLSLNSDYIGPLRMSPARELSELDITTNFEKVGYTGAYAYNIILQDGLNTLHPLTDSINMWFKKNFDGWGIQLNKEKDPFFQIEITRARAKVNINLKDVGQGMSQALPLIVKAKMKTEKEELIPIEQPELHLHPAAHGSLAELFVESLESGLKNYLIETHSQNFVLRLRRLIAEKKYKWFNKESFAFYYVDFDEIKEISSLRKINVDDLGKVDYWPKDIFTETLIETSALKDAQSNNSDRK